MFKLAVASTLALAGAAFIFETSGPLGTRSFTADVVGTFFLIAGLIGLVILIIALRTERSMRYD